MPDRFSAEDRSAVMRSVKGRSTEPELLMRRLLTNLGLRYREQASDLPGKPDFVSDALRLALFVDGDWWHGRDWPDRKSIPIANAVYWEAKLGRNVRRDGQVTARLRSMGWSVVRIWESDLRSQPQVVSKRVAGKVRRRDLRMGTNTNLSRT